MIDERDKDALRVCRKRSNADSNRSAHFAVRIGVDCEGGGFDMNTDFIRSMSEHRYDLVYTTCAQIVDTRFDDCFVAKGKERLESAHAARFSGSQENCCYTIHIWSSRKALNVY